MHDLLDALAAAWQLVLSGDSTLISIVSLSLRLTSPDGQRTIDGYKINGAQLFFSDAKGSPS